MRRVARARLCARLNANAQNAPSTHMPNATTIGAVAIEVELITLLCAAAISLAPSPPALATLARALESVPVHAMIVLLIIADLSLCVYQIVHDVADPSGRAGEAMWLVIATIAIVSILLLEVLLRVHVGLQHRVGLQ